MNVESANEDLVMSHRIQLARKRPFYVAVACVALVICLAMEPYRFCCIHCVQF